MELNQEALSIMKKYNNYGLACEIERLKDEYIMLQNSSDEVENKLREEIEDLRKNYLEAIDNYEQERYKNNKAIEYIEEHRSYYYKDFLGNGEKQYDDTFNKNTKPSDLLEILKGDSNE